MTAHPTRPLGNRGYSSIANPIPRRTARTAIVALADVASSQRWVEALQPLGFETHLANSHGQARRLAQRFRARVALLEAEPLKLESGFLACGKIMLDNPDTRILLLGAAAADNHEKLARFVGSLGYFSHDIPPATLLPLLNGSSRRVSATSAG